ncbi:hypothetical protein BDQ12DRAFT_725021 [Crucibulum laeve]|uniref:Uncharacterized protein n=1 Tax=Crucibulum laeve TaxID=68775 RepID=A0A5C3LUX8_9AGAR|nr:hypothetical protein BDQ12DRAFT_725021 [Crucibulum laeve]
MLGEGLTAEAKVYLGAQEAVDVQGNGIFGTRSRTKTIKIAVNPNTGWFIHGNNGAWSVVYYSVSTLNVIYRHAFPDTFTVVQSSPTDLETAHYIVTAGLVTDLNTNVTEDAYEEAYSPELGRQQQCHDRIEDVGDPSWTDDSGNGDAIL